MSRHDETRYRAAEAALCAAYAVRPREHQVEVATLGARCRVLELGDPGGAPVLFLHGSPNTAVTWLGLARELPGHRCLLFERPGAGLSTPARWTHHRRDVGTLLGATLDALGVARADVVGSSFGGLYAYELALEAPARVRRLVQLGAPASAGPISMPGIFRVLSLPGLSLLLRNGMKPDAAEARKMFAEIGHGEAVARGVIPDAVFAWYSALLCHTDTLPHLLGEIRAVATPFGPRASARVTRDELAGLRVPLLYLWGDRDSFATPAQAEALAALTPGARLERHAGFGHLPWMDDPVAIGARVREFLAGAGAEPAAALAG